MCGTKLKTKVQLKIRGYSQRLPMPFQFVVKKSYNHDLIVTTLIAKKNKNAMSTEMRRNEIYNETIDV